MKQKRLKELQSEPLIVERIDFTQPSQIEHVNIMYDPEELKERQSIWVQNNPIWHHNTIEKHGEISNAVPVFVVALFFAALVIGILLNIENISKFFGV